MIYLYLLDVRNLVGPAVYTVSSSYMVPRLAAMFGTNAYETPVGFKHVAAKMVETEAIIGGEESGGFGYKMHLLDRDGLASGVFVLDFIISRGRAMSEAIAEVQRLVGPSVFSRVDIPLEKGLRTRTRAALADLVALRAGELPHGVFTRSIALEHGEGIKCYIEDGSWLLIRLSGTEGLLRIYAEARSKEGVAGLIDAGHDMLDIRRSS